MACALSVVLFGIGVRAKTAESSAVETAGVNDAIEITADWSQEWRSGEEYIGLFRGHCVVTQGQQQYSAEKLVIWSREEGDGERRRQKLTFYLEDRVVIDEDQTKRNEASAALELHTQSGVTLSVKGRNVDSPADDDALYQRAVQRRRAPKRGLLQQTQFSVENDGVETWQAIPIATPQSMRRVRVYQRSALPFDVDSRRLTNRTPPEQVTIVTGGVTILIEGFTIDQLDNAGTIDLSADRAIIWTDALNGQEFSTDSPLPADAKYQVYLEGNIVIRQGDHVVRADRAYYDARDNRALVLNAELQAFSPLLGVGVRVRAERLRQFPDQSFHAQNAWVTTSQYGRPGFRVEASEVTVEQRPINLFGQRPIPQVDPETGELQSTTQPWTTVRNSTVYLGDTPVFYLPYSTGTPEDISTPLVAVSFQQDSIFGSQFYSKWNTFKLLGMERPEGTNWFVDLNYLSERGPYVGTDGNYQGLDYWGNSMQGSGLASFIYDSGRDNLGLDRRSLVPPDKTRGRINLRHKTIFSPETVFQGEIGYVSDRNFLEQYYESEFDRGKDQETLGYLKHTVDNWSASLLARPQVNPFEYNTQWLPKADAYVLGEPVFDTFLNWSMHSSVGYASLNNPRTPTDPNDLFSPLPYYSSGEGVAAMTRHQLTAPFQAGELKIVPYALGEAAYWGDSFTNDEVSRLYGRTGVRASLLVWKPMPWVQSDFFNLNGLAHKMVFTADYAVAGSTQPLNTIAQWNEFDDDAQERFRERLLVNTFGGVLPGQFDPRFYAVRSGAGATVSAPYHELVDSQQVLSLGWQQRLQTKVGPQDQLRLKDWMTLDLGINFYPSANRDNFGEHWGLFSSRYAWHVGDRTSILASTLYDFFDGGQQIWNVGVLSQRTYRGSVYFGMRQIRGGSLDSQIVTASYSYVMTPEKWLSTMTTAYDLTERRNLGQAFTITRIGEFYLLHVGMNFDASKNNVGLTVSAEPKFGPFNTGVPMFGPSTGTTQ